MRGFLLEVLAGRTWKRSGQTYFTLADANREAQRIIRRGKGIEVRVFPVEIGSDAVGSFAADDAEEAE